MKKLLIVSVAIILFSCGNQNKVKIEKKTESMSLQASKKNAPSADKFVKSPLRNSIKLELNAPVSEVWALVGKLERMPEYSSELRKVDAKYASNKCTGFTCHFLPMEEGGQEMTHDETIMWYEPNVGFASLADEPNALGLQQSLGVITLKNKGDKTILKWDVHFTAENEEVIKMNVVGFEEALNKEIAQNLIKIFGGVILESYPNNEIEEVGTIVLVMSKTKSEYSQEEVIQLSKAIDPMVDKFDGYLGRKMAFSNKENNLMIDVVYYTDEKAAIDAAEKEMKSEICHKFFATLDDSTTKIWTFSPVIITDTKKGEVKIIELVLSKPKPGYTKDEIIKTGKSVNPILKEFDGFISRKLAFTEDGVWMDLVYWTDLEKAEAASKAVLDNKIAQKYFEMADEKTVQFMHLNVVIDTEKVK